MYKNKTKRIPFLVFKLDVVLLVSQNKTFYNITGIGSASHCKS